MLIACLSTGKGTWTEVNKLIQSQPWDKVFLITSQFGQENFTNKPENTELILIDTFAHTSLMVENIKSQLKDKISDFEVAINLVSGSGKEHMAVLESVLEMGLNFRIVTLNNFNQLDVLGIKR